MQSDAVSGAWRDAVALTSGGAVIEGPLKGYHHETYVIPLAVDDIAATARWKCREPRPGLFWYDRRCFASEDELVRALAGRVTRIPPVFDSGGLTLQGFIEGLTLGALHPFGKTVPGRLVDQILDVFRELVVIDPSSVPVRRTCSPQDMPADGETGPFLDRLIHFIEDRVYQPHIAEFGSLFHELGIDDRSFKRLHVLADRLHTRPFSLLHADLHRENLVIDHRRQLWVIDWELAMLGDPLYDLATHLYLMRYPVWQRHRLCERWCATVERVREGASFGWREDLPLLLDFKRAQSVFTDVIRVALTLRDASAASPDEQLAEAGLRLHHVLRRAREPLGLTCPPPVEEVVGALRRWLASYAD